MAGEQIYDVCEVEIKNKLLNNFCRALVTYL
jgi:hypothetical protein